MVAEPLETPVTIPVVEPTVATALLLLLHSPPTEGDVNVVVALWQTKAEPGTGAGVPVTVTAEVAVQPVGSV